MTPQEKLRDLDEAFPQRKQMPLAGFLVTGEQLDWLINRANLLTEKLEKIRYWKSDANVCCFPTDFKFLDSEE